jgi:hypothetical protein
VITGVVNAKHEATVSIVVLGPKGQTREIEAVIDTGFTLPFSLIVSLAAGLMPP